MMQAMQIDLKSETPLDSACQKSKKGTTKKPHKRMASNEPVTLLPYQSADLSQPLYMSSSVEKQTRPNSMVLTTSTAQSRPGERLKMRGRQLSEVDLSVHRVHNQRHSKKVYSDRLMSTHGDSGEPLVILAPSHENESHEVDGAASKHSRVNFVREQNNSSRLTHKRNHKEQGRSSRRSSPHEYYRQPSHAISPDEWDRDSKSTDSMTGNYHGESQYILSRHPRMNFNAASQQHSETRYNLDNGNHTKQSGMTSTQSRIRHMRKASESYINLSPDQIIDINLNYASGSVSRDSSTLSESSDSPQGVHSLLGSTNYVQKPIRRHSYRNAQPKPGHSVEARKRPDSASRARDVKEQVDYDSLARALQIVVADNRFLKKQFEKSQIKIDELNNQLLQELQARSEQHRHITQCIKHAQNLKNKIEKEAQLPRWIARDVIAGLQLLYKALTSQVGENNENSSYEDSDNPTVEEKADSRQFSTDSFRQANSAHNLTRIARRDDSPASIEDATGNYAAVQSPHTHSFRENEPIQSDSRNAKIPPYQVPPLIENQKSASDIVEIPSQSPDKSSQAMPKSNIRIPVLSLKAKNIGHGAWLSGDQTQGDTYNDAS